MAVLLPDERVGKEHSATLRRADDLCPRSQRGSRSGNAHAFVAVRWHGHGDYLGKTQFWARRSKVRGDPFRHAHHATDDCVHRFARTRDSALGGVLSLALLSSLGICLLLL